MMGLSGWLALFASCKASGVDPEAGAMLQMKTFANLKADEHATGADAAMGRRGCQWLLPGDRPVYLKAHDGKFVQSHGWSHTAFANGDGNGATGQFAFHMLPSGKYAMRSHNGRWLNSRPGHVVFEHTGSNHQEQAFDVECTSHVHGTIGKISLKSHRNEFVTSRHHHLYTSHHRGDHEMFEVVQVPQQAEPCLPNLANNNYVTLRALDGRFVVVQDNNFADANSDHVGRQGRERFFAMRAPSGMFYFRAWTGSNLACHSDGGLDAIGGIDTIEDRTLFQLKCERDNKFSLRAGVQVEGRSGFMTAMGGGLHCSFQDAPNDHQLFEMSN